MPRRDRAGGRGAGGGGRRVDGERRRDDAGEKGPRQQEPPRRNPPDPPREPKQERGAKSRRDRKGGKGGGRSSPPIDRPGGPSGAAPPRAKAAEPRPASARGRVLVGSTGNSPELVETVPIATAPAPVVVLSFGPGAKTDSPLPDIAAGDRLEVLAELELTTDAEDPDHPGLVGDAYSYAPEVEATLLLASGPGEADAAPGRAVELARPWRRPVTHQQHHAVVAFDASYEVPKAGPGWSGDSYVNVVVSASSPEAGAGDVLLVGQNEKTPTVVQDMAGVRVVRHRAGAADPTPRRDTSCRVGGVPVAKSETVVFSTELDGLAEGEQLLVRAALVTDAAPLGYAARISTRLFLADDADQVEPGGNAAALASWKGHVSKFTGFNCLPEEGAQTSLKYGVAKIEATPPGPLFVNLVAVSAAPFGGESPGDALPIDTSRSFLEVVRYPPDVAG